MSSSGGLLAVGGPPASATVTGPYTPSGAAAPVRSTDSSELLSPTARRLIMALFLAAIAGLAAYYCLNHGFQYLDVARTGFETFKGGALVYMGVTFSFVAVGNLLYGIGKATFGSAADPYGREDVVKHVGVTLLAPLAVVPFAIYAGAMAAMARK